MYILVKGKVAFEKFSARPLTQREFCIDNLPIRIHFIIGMIWWTGLAPWDFEFPFPGSLIPTFLGQERTCCRGRMWKT